jgi:hypothetical protein
MPYKSPPKSRFPPIPYSVNEIPPRLSWKIHAQIPRVDVPVLCERLYSIVMDRKGASFHYPDDLRTQTICRYEWHRRIGSNRQALRLGIAFTVNSNDLTEIECYATTSDAIRNVSEPSLSTEEAKIAQQETIKTLEEALYGMGQERPWLFVFHIEAPYGKGFSQRVSLEDKEITIFPTRILGDLKRVSAVIIGSVADSRAAARNLAFARLATACALLTLAQGERYEIARSEGTTSRPIPQTISSITHLKEDRLYPGRRKWPRLEEVDELAPRRFSWAWSAFSDLTAEDANTFKAPLFAYYGATLRSSDFSTLSAVGYAAALSALAKNNKTKCEGSLTCSKCGKLTWKHDVKGEVPAMVEFLVGQLNIREATSQNKIKAVLTRIYREQRSSFVHGALHRHKEYGQGALLPAALPAKGAVFQESLTYSEDLLNLGLITRSALLHSLAKLAGRELDLELFGGMSKLSKFSHSADVGMPLFTEIQMIS